MSSNRLGRISGDTRTTLHSADAVRLFRGDLSEASQKKGLFKISVELFSTKTWSIAQYARLDDPIAAEILVLAEERLASLNTDALRRKTELDGLLEPLKSGLSIESVSTKPAVFDCTRFNPLGMRAVVSLILLDQLFLSHLQSVHVGLLQKRESSRRCMNFSSQFRSILTTAFTYRPKATREDFDQQNTLATELLCHYRRQHYIKQTDTRSDQDLCLHYASYDREPGWF